MDACRSHSSLSGESTGVSLLDLSECWTVGQRKTTKRDLARSSSLQNGNALIVQLGLRFLRMRTRRLVSLLQPELGTKRGNASTAQIATRTATRSFQSLSSLAIASELAVICKLAVSLLSRAVSLSRLLA